MEVRSAVERRTIPDEGETKLGCVLSVEGGESASSRPPINLALVIDISGSMAGDNIRHAIEASVAIVGRLRTTDHIAVVTFGETAQVVVPSQHAKDPAEIVRRIRAIRVGGATNMSGGWTEGLRQVLQSWQETATNRIVLLTDGLANRGVIEPSQLTGLVANAQTQSQRIETTTVGVGTDYNEDLLMSMARAGGGNYHYAANADAASEAFRQEFLDLEQVVAQNLRLTLRFGPQVKAFRQLTEHASDTDPSEHTLTLRLGDLSAGTRRLVGLNLDVDPAGESEVPLFACTLEAISLAEDRAEPVTLTARCAVAAAADPDEVPFAERDRDAAFDLTMVRLSHAVARANQLVATGRPDDALELLDRAKWEVCQGPFPQDPNLGLQLDAVIALQQAIRMRPDSQQGTAARKASTYLSNSVLAGTVRFRSQELRP